jgi:hypothetical protein
LSKTKEKPSHYKCSDRVKWVTLGGCVITEPREFLRQKGQCLNQRKDDSSRIKEPGDGKELRRPGTVYIAAGDVVEFFPSIHKALSLIPSTITS